jgi:hypothetical protein
MFKWILRIIFTFILLGVIGYIISNAIIDDKPGIQIKPTITGNAVKQLESPKNITQQKIQAQPNPKIQNYAITADELKKVIFNSPAFQDFPDDGALCIKFYDGNGKDLQNKQFMLRGKEVVNGCTDADLLMATGDYNIPLIKESKDLCQTIKTLRQKQDCRFDKKISLIKMGIKYRNMMQFKDCLS